MKNSLLILTVLLSIGTIQAEQTNLSSKQLYQNGVTAMKSGNISAAKNAFQAALKKNPNHGDSRYMLSELKNNEGKIRANNAKKTFSEVFIKEFNLEAAELEESLELLQKKVEDATGGVLIQNFIVKDPSKKLSGRKITLKLKGVPAGAVLNYVCETIEAKADHGRYGIMISPR